MTAFYNEIDPFAADWIRNLIDRGLVAPGVVDTRSIMELDPNELKQYTQVHLFAGVGGWSLALRLAGWPDDRPVWTGSCPCQPFSSAGKQKGHADERHLWPAMFRLVRECRPSAVFGEQVSSAIGHGWFDGVFGDLEGAGYACGASVLGAFSVGAPHKRSRLYWVADAESPRKGAISRSACKGFCVADGGGNALALGDSCCGGRRAQGHASQPPSGVDWAGADRAVEYATSPRCSEEREQEQPGRRRGMPVAGRGVDTAEHPAGDRRDAGGTEPDGQCAAGGCGVDGVGVSNSTGPLTGRLATEAARHRGSAITDGGLDAWSDFTIAHCTDGNARRVGRSVFPLVAGLPRDMGRGQPELFRLARRARGNRTGRLKGYGNAIVPQVAAVFIRAAMEAHA